jgi:ferritin-like metal-binding protein YciE
MQIMKNTYSTQTEKSTKSNADKTKHIKAKGLRDLFIDEIKDIYWAEKALVKAIPSMIKNATGDELAEALKGHLEVTKEHVNRLEKVFLSLGKKAEAIKCEAMAGLIKEAEEIMQETHEGAVRDAGIISAGQKVEHYEIATYGALCSFAKSLGENEIASILKKTLDDELDANKKLTEIAENSVNAEAAELDNNAQK